MNTNHSQHHLGHTMFVIGAFLMMFSVTLLSPVQQTIIYAFGAQEIIDASNQARSRFSAEPLSSNSLLMSAAQKKAEDMVQKQYFAHIAPDGTEPWDYFKEVGYTYELAGENLAITNESVEKIIDGWLNSTSHKENLLNPKYIHTGIGIAKYGTYKGHTNTTVVVALYGSVKEPIAVTGTEPTYPAGTTTIMQPKLLNINPNILLSLAAGLLIAGSLYEIRRLRRHHHPNAEIKT